MDEDDDMAPLVEIQLDGAGAVGGAVLDSGPPRPAVAPAAGGDDVSDDGTDDIVVETFEVGDDGLLARNAQPSQGKATMSSSVFNLVNTIVGAGILALPFGFAHSGLALGSLILLLISCASAFSLDLLVACSRFSGQGTYSDLAFHAYGPWAKVFCDLVLVMQTSGACIAYLVIIGDLVPPSLAVVEIEVARHAVIPVATLLVVYPLSLMRNINSLRFTSSAAIAAVLYLAAMVLVRQPSATLGRDVSLANTSIDIFWTIPVLSFAFACHFNIFAIQRELSSDGTRGSDGSRMQRVNHVSVAICFALYMLVGVGGYLTCFETCKGNLLLNYEQSDPLVLLATIGLAFVLVFSFPLVARATRESIWRLCGGADAQPTFRAHIIITTVITGISMVIAMVVPDVEIVFDLTGSAATSLVCFVFPSLFYIRIYPGPLRQPRKIFAIVLAAVGTVVAVVGTTLAIGKTFFWEGEEE